MLTVKKNIYFMLHKKNNFPQEYEASTEKKPVSVFV